MTKVSLDQMKAKLLSLDDVVHELQKTEPLSIEHISNETKIAFHLDPDWAEGIDALSNTHAIGATIRINGQERQITKEGMYQAAANFGLTAPYIKKVPANLIEGLLNYHYSGGMGSNEYSMFTVGEYVSAFTRPTVAPFSNLQLLDKTVEGIKKRLGRNPHILADYKFHNSLQRTDVRLVLPSEERVMVDTNMADVPVRATDNWYSGIHLSNSLVGKTQTSLEAYMFRWWCTNGATTTLDAVGTWSRRVNGQQDDVYDWARDTVDEILGGMEYRFDQIQSLAALNVAGNTVDILREIFRDYEVPVSQRDTIQARLLEQEGTLTMYSIMQAITQVANEEDMDDRRRDKLMRIGGAIPTATFDTLKARVWREGHTADPDVPNPYEVRVIQAAETPA